MDTHMINYNFAENDFKNLEASFPESFLRLNYLKALREVEELRTYANKINKELNILKAEQEAQEIQDARIPKN